MIKQLRRVGNSSALILDRALMELVGLDENGKVSLAVRDGSLIVTPADPRPVDPARFQACLDRVVRARRAALRRLAQ
jgi:antitoxin component of MazEF toxin-antitoxin module